jgi:hypothetical protein
MSVNDYGEDLYAAIEDLMAEGELETAGRMGRALAKPITLLRGLATARQYLPRDPRHLTVTEKRPPAMKLRRSSFKHFTL